MRSSLDFVSSGSGLAANVILVTNNVREFARVPGLRLQNWAEPKAPA